jgi:toxin YoeB
VKVVFSSRGWDDYLWWQRQDRKLLKRINQLIQDVMRNGNEGIGKPEPLKHGFQGYWSRRITDEHRLVYLQGRRRRGAHRGLSAPLRTLT